MSFVNFDGNYEIFLGFHWEIDALFWNSPAFLMGIIIANYFRLFRANANLEDDGFLFSQEIDVASGEEKRFE